MIFSLKNYKLFSLCWRSSTVEQLICNQQVAGSIPIASLNGNKTLIFLVERYPSGQRGQTVNLLAMPTEVRILLSPPSGVTADWAGVAQPARASAFQAEGRGFESRLPLHSETGSTAQVAQSVERILGKDEVHRFDPGLGLHRTCVGSFFVQRIIIIE